MRSTNIVPACDENRPTAAWDGIEFRSGTLIVGCKCVRNDGMQHECRRAMCMGRPECLAHPAPTCPPSQPCPPLAAEHRADERKPPGRQAAAAAASEPVERRKRRARGATDCQLRQYAKAQYDDRPTLERPFEPCPVHRFKRTPNKCKPPAEAPPPPPAEDDTRFYGQTGDEYVKSIAE